MTDTSTQSDRVIRVPETGEQVVISVVLPVYDEEDTLHPLYDSIVEVLEDLGKPFELLFVDDGSTDASASRVEEIVKRDSRAKLVRLRGHSGKSSALAAGFDQSRGDLVLTLDTDLQDDPTEIPRFVDKLEQGYDLVCGYKKVRKDPLHKVISSRLFNYLVARATGVRLHDMNCGFKCFRKEVIEEIKVYGELHRFIPVLAWWRRFRVTEIPVKHHPRRYGKSKYGFGRMFAGIMDLLTVYLFVNYEGKPGHLFGKVGVSFSILGFLILLYLAILWFLGLVLSGTALSCFSECSS